MKPLVLPFSLSCTASLIACKTTAPGDSNSLAATDGNLTGYGCRIPVNTDLGFDAPIDISLSSETSGYKLELIGTAGSAIFEGGQKVSVTDSQGINAVLQTVSTLQFSEAPYTEADRQRIKRVDVIGFDDSQSEVRLFVFYLDDGAHYGSVFLLDDMGSPCHKNQAKNTAILGTGVKSDQKHLCDVPDRSFKTYCVQYDVAPTLIPLEAEVTVNKDSLSFDWTKNVLSAPLNQTVTLTQY